MLASFFDSRGTCFEIIMGNIGFMYPSPKLKYCGPLQEPTAALGRTQLRAPLRPRAQGACGSDMHIVGVVMLNAVRVMSVYVSQPMYCVTA